MFRGSHPTRIDEKGRLKLPAEFKHLIDETHGNLFFITSEDGERAKVYPLPVWQEIEKKLALIPNMNEAKRKYLDRVNYYGQMSEMDAQGRVLLPQILRESATLAGDAVVVGKQSYLEVANHDRYVKKLEAEPMTAQERQALENFGI